MSTTTRTGQKRSKSTRTKAEPAALPKAILNLPERYRLQLVEDLAGSWAGDETVGEAFAFLYEQEKTRARRKTRPG